MGCSNCAVLRERVQELERELGLRMKNNGVALVGSRLGLQPMVARAVLVLYQAKGNFVSTEDLIERASFGCGGNLRTRMSLARRILGEGSIPTAWGHGYRLSPEAMALVTRTLES